MALAKNKQSMQLVFISYTDLPLLSIHNPSVQFFDCKTGPSQSFPPFLGGGFVQSLRRQCVHSVPQVDHLLHAVHSPSSEKGNIYE